MVIAASSLPAEPDPESGPDAQPRLRVVGGDNPRHVRPAGRTERTGIARTPEEDNSELVEARRAARRRLHGPAPLIGQLAMAVLEIEAGLRSASQLEKFCRPDVWEVLTQRFVGV
jgi:hypothetical protein